MNIYDSLRGDAEPLRRFGVTLTTPIPWWRHRLQRYVAPRRFRLWMQRQILRELEDEAPVPEEEQ